uniref:Neur_chan_LBD domain-containing protein n=1 Tax=Ascaris lumbricoides TaxID=6252 RepID=A0A0M3I510_ASCLU
MLWEEWNLPAEDYLCSSEVLTQLRPREAIWFPAMAVPETKISIHLTRRTQKNDNSTSALNAQPANNVLVVFGCVMRLRASVRFLLCALPRFIECAVTCAAIRHEDAA